jgi:hypothetical protein
MDEEADGVVFDGPVWVAYSQVYLDDVRGFDGDLESYLAGPDGARLVGAKAGCAVMMTGMHTGPVSFAVMMTEADPGPVTGYYEDIAEVSIEATSDVYCLVEWAGERSHRLPRLPRGPGSYRLRYHARGMDAANDPTVFHLDGPIVDEYLLQIWPAPHAAPAILKLTSRTARSR